MFVVVFFFFFLSWFTDEFSVEIYFFSFHFELVSFVAKVFREFFPSFLYFYFGINVIIFGDFSLLLMPLNLMRNEIEKWPSRFLPLGISRKTLETSSIKTRDYLERWWRKCKTKIRKIYEENHYQVSHFLTESMKWKHVFVCQQFFSFLKNI